MKVDRPRAEEIVMRHFLSADGYGNRLRGVDSVMDAVREQTEWLMKLVCSVCGEDAKDMDCCNYRTQEEPITRAEYLRQRGEKS